MNQKDFYDNYHQHHAPHVVTQLLHDEKRRVIGSLIRQQHQKANARILVAGCGLGEDAEIIGSPTIATDLSTTALIKASQRYPNHIYVTADSQKLPFQSGQFDLIVCSEVIEHIPHPEIMVGEFHRLLHLGGSLIITTPNWISFYGLARRLGEFILKKPITSANQPIDHWYTKNLLARQLTPYFGSFTWRGVWFFPPIGLGNKTLPAAPLARLFTALQPIERFLQPRLTGFAHLLAIHCVSRTLADSTEEG